MSQLTLTSADAPTETSAPPCAGVVLQPVAESLKLPPRRLAPGEHVIGSGPDCDVVVAASGVAERHCRIIVGDNRTRVRAESPLTWINDGVVRDGRLRTGDRLIVGPVEFRIREPFPSELLHRNVPASVSAVASQAGDDVETLIEEVEARNELTASLEATADELEHHQAQVEHAPPPAPESEFSFSEQASKASATQVLQETGTAPDAAVETQRAYLARLAETLDSRERELTAREAEVRCRWDEIAVTRVGSPEWEEAVYRERTELSRERADLRAHRAEIETAREQIAAERRAVDEHHQEILRQEEKLHATRLELDAVRRELDGRRVEFAERERSLAGHRASLDDERAEIMRRQRELDEQARQVAEEREAAESQAKRAAESSAKQEQHFAAERANLAALQDELNQRQTDYDASLAELEESRRQLEQSRAELEAGNAALESDRAELEQVRREIAGEREELAARAAELEEREVRLATAEREQAERADIDTGNHVAEDSADDDGERVAEELRRLAEDRESLEVAREELIRDRAVLDEKYQSLELERTHLEEERVAWSAEQAAGREGTESARLKWDQLELERAELQAERESLEAERNEVRRQLSELSAVAPQQDDVSPPEPTSDEPVDEQTAATDDEAAEHSPAEPDSADFTAAPTPGDSPVDLASVLSRMTEESIDSETDAAWELPEDEHDAETAAATIDAADEDESSNEELGLIFSAAPAESGETPAENFPARPEELRSKLAEMFGIGVTAGRTGTHAAESEAAPESSDNEHAADADAELAGAAGEHSHQDASASKASSLSELLARADLVRMTETESEESEETGDSAPLTAHDTVVEQDATVAEEERDADDESESIDAGVQEAEPDGSADGGEQPHADGSTETVESSRESDPIAEYMEKLLRRNGVSAAGEDAARAATATNQAIAAAVDAESVLARSVGPEEKESLRAHLDSFRELANISARTAVAKHESKKLRTVIQVKAVLTTISIGLTAALGSAHLIGEVSYIPYVIAAGVVSLIMGGDLLRTLLTLYHWKSIESAGAGYDEEEPKPGDAPTDEPAKAADSGQDAQTADA